MSTVDTEDALLTLELRKLPYDRRWNILKPKLEGLFYTTEVGTICRILKELWGFCATYHSTNTSIPLGWLTYEIDKPSANIGSNLGAGKRASQRK